MASTILDVVAEATYTAWALAAGADKMVAVQQPLDDATYISKASTDGPESYTIDSLPAAANVVLSHILTSRCKWYAGPNSAVTKAGVRTGGSNYWGATHADASFTTQTDSNLYQANPTVAEVNAMEIAINATGMTAPDGYYCSMLYLTPTWKPMDGGFCYLISQWLPPLLAVASHCLTKLDVVAILSSLKTRPSDDKELARILEAFKRRPVYGFLAS